MYNSKTLFKQTYGKKLYTHIAVMYFSTTVIASAELIEAVLMGRIMNSLSKPFSYVLLLFWAIFGVMVFEILASIFYSYKTAVYTNKYTDTLRKLIGHKVCTCRYQDIESCENGDVLTTVTNDTECMGDWISTLFSLGYIPVRVIVTLIVCFLISWKVTILLLISMPLLLLLGAVFSKKLYSLNLQEKNEKGKVNTYLLNMFSFLPIIKTYQLEDLFINKNNQKLLYLYDVKKKSALRVNAIGAYNGMVAFLPIIALFTIGGIFVILKQITIGNIVSYSFMLNILSEGISTLQQIPVSKRNMQASSDRIIRLLNMNDEHKDVPVIPSEKTDEIYHFEHVGFYYEQNKQILKDISFSIFKGEKIAVIGKSGSGKTTLFKLMCGLYEPTEGTAFFKGIDIVKLSVDEIRKNISIALQESFLMPDTLRNNMTIGNEDISKSAVKEASEHAHVADFADKMPAGYDTVLMKQGSRISRGQAQRICLGRAFLRKTPVYLFDEPTSALDIGTHERVMDYITDGFNGSTVIVITHKLPDPKKFDKILYMENGSIKAFGSYEYLMKNGISIDSLTGDLGLGTSEMAEGGLLK